MPPDARGSARRTPVWLRGWRFTRLILHVAWGCVYSGLTFPFYGSARQMRAIRNFARGILRILNVRVKVEGEIPDARARTVIVANHVSWLDIWVVHAVCPVRFVAKSDIRRWPVIGWLVGRAGTIFIERERRHDTARTNRQVIEALERGERVAVFPEGTTTDGSEVKPFHASLFQPALGANARVVPAAIRYPRDDGTLNLDAAYAGERSLMQSVRLILRQRLVEVELKFAAVIEVRGKTRRALAHESQQAIVHALGLPASGKTPGRGDGPRGARQTDAGPTHSPYRAPGDPLAARGRALTSARK
jgi:1-acyl-sn-glycerol-3-phosphate acyltransferase